MRIKEKACDNCKGIPTTSLTLFHSFKDAFISKQQTPEKNVSNFNFEIAIFLLQH